jgi:hypothetical protein
VRVPCSQDQCQKRARWLPVVLLRRSAKSEPASVRFRRLGYCDEHKAASTLPTVLSDEGFARLAKHLRESGLPEPKPQYSELVWERLLPADLQRLARRQDQTLSPPKDPDGGPAF